MFELKLLSIILLSASFVIDTGQVAVRITSGMQGVPLLGAHTAQVLLLVNRAAVACVMVIIGYLIDGGERIETLFSLYLITTIIVSFMHIIVIRPLIISVFNVYATRVIHKVVIEVPKAFRVHGRRQHRLWGSLIFVTVVNFFGLLGPSLLAAALPEFRATLMQSGFVINTIGTLIYVIHIEKQIAIKINNMDDLEFLFSDYIYSRIFAYFLISAIFITVYTIF